MAALLPTPRYCIQHGRFNKQDGWRLRDISVQLYENIAVTCFNKSTDQTSIDVYSVRNSDSRDKPKIFYSKQFEKYEDEEYEYYGRSVSFVDSYGDNRGLVIATGIGDKLELFDLIQDRVLKSRKITLINHGSIRCLSVREKEIFIGFWRSNKITVYDVIDLNEIKSIFLQGIQDGYTPYDMTAIADRIFVCVGDGKEGSDQRSLIFEEKNGRILSELTKPTDTYWYVISMTVSVTLDLVACVLYDSYNIVDGTRFQIVFYSLFSENNSSFLIVEIEFGVTRIRISDRGDRMVTGNQRTGEVKVYDMAQIFSYDRMKEHIASYLQRNECVKLTKFFALPKDQTEVILKSDTPMENLIAALEEKGVIQPSNVDRLIEALKEVTVNSSCYIMADIYQRIKMHATLYDKFIAILATHLTASLPSDLCIYFKIPDGKKSSITWSQNPGLSLLLALDEMDIINSSDTTALEQPFTEHKLVQAVAKIHEYQSTVEEERKGLFGKDVENNTLAGKAKLFIKYLQKKLKSWYETMTPVPWKKSCRWKSTDLFVACGLILTDSKTKRNLTNIDDQCKLNYTEIFSHKKLHEESRIILEGDPGSGKTMLSSQLAYDWSQGKISGINILIFLPLKLVENKTLVEAIRDFYLPEDNSLSLSDIEDVIAYEGIECCFLLDGLEEYNGENTSTVEEPSEIMKIMTKQKYPSCKVVITSRSDYAQDLPPCPILKIGQFGQFERSAYIEKVFSSDREKQLKVKEAVEDTPFILDLCKIPLLFVLAVHVIADKKTVGEGQLNRVTPFIKNIVESLCTPGSSLREVWKKGLVYNKYQDNWRDMLHLKVFSNVSTHEYEDGIAYSELNVPRHHRHELLQSKSEPLSLEMLAFNGLCKGNQQLSWAKSFVEDSVKDIKQWMDSGILVIEEAVAVVKAAQKTTPKSPEEKDARKSLNEHMPSTSVFRNIERYTDNNAAEAIKEGILGETQQVTGEDDIGSIPLAGEFRTSDASFADFGMIQRGVKSDNQNSALSRNDESVAHQYSAVKFAVDDQSTTFTTREEDKNSTFALKYVPLQVKFLHKIIQEWFAARYLVSLCWRNTKLPLLKQYELLRKHLHHINPADLHYVLRFTCYLCPPSCHFILNYLLVTYRSEEGDIPEYILNCICLCLAEAEDDKDDYLKDIASEICKITFTIQPEDSRLLQAAKSALLKFASICGFPIPQLILRDVVVKAEKDELTLNSGGTMETLETLQVLEVSRWDKDLKEKDYYNVMEFIASSASIRMAYLHFPVPQPPVPSEETLEKLMFHHTSVTWKIGSKLSLELDTATGEWKLSGGEYAVQASGPIQPEANSGTLKSMSDYKDKENYDSSIEQSREPSTSASLPGISGISTSTQTKRETLTRHGTEFSQFTSETLVFEKGRKVDSTKEEETQSFQQGQSQIPYDQNLLQAQAVMTQSGGTIEIPNTGVVLNVPPGALPEGMEECSIQMRIIPFSALQEKATCFSSNSSVRVELLPNHLTFRQPVRLMLPHCLQLKKGATYKAKIFMSHHNEGEMPHWVKQKDQDYQLLDTTCIIWMTTFCWKKYEIDDKIVEAKRVQIYAAAKKMYYLDKEAVVEIGYHLDMPGEHELLEMNPDLVLATRKTFLFLREGKHSLYVHLNRIVPEQWKNCDPERNPKEIPFDNVAASVEYLCPFMVAKKTEDQDLPMCMFTASQLNCSVDLIIRPEKSLEDFVSHTSDISPKRQGITPSTESETIRVTGNIPSSQSKGTYRSLDEQLRDYFMLLKKNLAADWMDFGRYLDVLEGDLRRLRKEYKDEIEEGIYQMLLCWKQKNGLQATPEKLIGALNKLYRTDLAETLTALYRQGEEQRHLVDEEEGMREEADKEDDTGDGQSLESTRQKKKKKKKRKKKSIDGAHV